MAKRKTQLVSQHLERISSDILEDYQKIIRDYIRNRKGVYALYKNNKLYYVRLADHKALFLFAFANYIGKLLIGYQSLSKL